MAETLKRSELNPEPETPQPFRNQELQNESAPERRDLRVETLSSNVVQWRPNAAVDAVSQLEAEGTAIPESTVAEEYLEFRDGISEMVDRGRRSVQDLAKRGRRRFRYWADEYPLQLLGAVAAAGFVAGILLRVWRSNRHE
jgi:hypothetical protein